MLSANGGLSHALRPEMRGFEGPVEADETYIGGKAHNMHRRRRERLGAMTGRSTPHKTAVAGVKDRPTSRVVAVPVPGVSAEPLTEVVAASTERGATVFTDEWRSYPTTRRRRGASGCQRQLEREPDHSRQRR